MDVRGNISNGKYENRVPYRVEKVPVDEEKMTVRQAREHAESEKLRDRKQKDLHRQENYRLRDLFQSDLEEEHGLAKHPKAARLFEMAWESGHSSGWESILNDYENMAELLK